MMMMIKSVHTCPRPKLLLSASCMGPVSVPGTAFSTKRLRSRPPFHSTHHGAKGSTANAHCHCLSGYSLQVTGGVNIMPPLWTSCRHARIVWTSCHHVRCGHHATTYAVDILPPRMVWTSCHHVRCGYHATIYITCTLGGVDPPLIDA